ncbi:DUF4150 domain-containing protein, partial [Archangium sp.]|uniref:DUF4150 domain-containing protein n=1 Tax=Archangium sp. TaxID=1872627 RepID=UPI002D4C017A
NVAHSSDLAKGTRTVNADGGNSIAVKGSEFSCSQGDEPGSLGGVKSGTYMKEATWLSYSMDVKMEGKNACRLTDKMLMNHGNAACLAGLVQQLIPILQQIGERAVLCKVLCHCKDNPKPSKEGRDGHQQCVEDTLNELDTAMGGGSTMKPEVPYNMLANPPAPISKNWMFHEHLKPKRPGMTSYTTGDVRVPDVVVLKNPHGPATQSNLKAVVEMKFGPDPWNSPSMRNRRGDYLQIAGDEADYWQLDAKACHCDEEQRQPAPVPAPETEPFTTTDALLLLAGAALLLTPIPGDEVIVGGAAAARALQALRGARVFQSLKLAF